MKVLIGVVMGVAVLSAVVSPVWAGGDKVQNEIGSETAPGPGSDAQGNQSH